MPDRELSPILVQETPLKGEVSCSLAMGSSADPFPPRALAIWMGLTPSLVAAQGWGIHPR